MQFSKLTWVQKAYRWAVWQEKWAQYTELKGVSISICYIMNKIKTKLFKAFGLKWKSKLLSNDWSHTHPRMHNEDYRSWLENRVCLRVIPLCQHHSHKA